MNTWHWGAMSAYEAMRIVLAMLVVFAASIGFVGAHMGEKVVPSAMRSRLRLRRRIQMGGSIVIAIALELQSVYAALLPDATDLAQVKTLREFLMQPAITGNLSLIIALSALLLLVAVHVIGWAGEHEIVHYPLIPDSAERADEAITLGRELGHAANNAFGIVVSALDIAILDPNIGEEEKELLLAAQQQTEHIIKHMQYLHERIRDLDPQLAQRIAVDEFTRAN